MFKTAYLVLASLAVVAAVVVGVVMVNHPDVQLAAFNACFNADLTLLDGSFTSLESVMDACSEAVYGTALGEVDLR